MHANADTPADALKARELGAGGIGLCRTEHMFMDRGAAAGRARDDHGRTTSTSAGAALAKLLPMQQADFEGIFEAMAGLPVTIRLLDPPLHEFLPPPEEADDERMRERIIALHETNPMLGTARLPARAAVAGDLRDAGTRDRPRGEGRRAAHAAPRRGSRSCTRSSPSPRSSSDCANSPSRTVAEEGGIDYACGTMIELPRACVRADEIAEHADFFSFGTNDLTQTALGFSRDDAEGTFLARYLERAHPRARPVPDARSIGRRRSHAHRCRARPRHAARHPARHLRRAWRRSGVDRLLPRLGLDYVSCSPYRVPVARLVAAQAALAAGRRRRLRRSGRLKLLGGSDGSVIERLTSISFAAG